MRPDLMSVDVDMITELEAQTMSSDVAMRKAFVQGVMEGMMGLSQDGRGPADRGFAIDLPFIVTP